jgi:hypothetical protein
LNAENIDLNNYLKDFKNKLLQNEESFKNLRTKYKNLKNVKKN